MIGVLRTINFTAAILLLTASASQANSQTLGSHCSSSAVREVSRPSYSDGRSGVFKLRYGVAEREDPDPPLIIFIPGGPGQTSMDAPLSYPSDFGVVRTDPRGVGCNARQSIPTDSFSSEAIAKDILAIVRDLKPKRYFIHAISYGTIPATIAAARADAAVEFALRVAKRSQGRGHRRQRWPSSVIGEFVRLLASGLGCDLEESWHRWQRRASSQGNVDLR